jgi:hypothetical protein
MFTLPHDICLGLTEMPQRIVNRAEVLLAMEINANEHKKVKQNNQGYESKKGTSRKMEGRSKRG